MSFSLFDYGLVEVSQTQDKIEANEAVFKQALNEAKECFGSFLALAANEFDFHRRIDLVGKELEQICIDNFGVENTAPLKAALKKEFVGHIDNDPGVRDDIVYEFIKYCEMFGKNTNDPASFEDFVEESNLPWNELTQSIYDGLVEINNSCGEIFTSFVNTELKIASSGWVFDRHQNAFLSKKKLAFECDCGSVLNVPSFSTCKCGKIWNAYEISSQGNSVFVAREVPVRNTIVD